VLVLCESTNVLLAQLASSCEFEPLYIIVAASSTKNAAVHIAAVKFSYDLIVTKALNEGAFLL
jgi:hypothetical protein